MTSVTGARAGPVVLVVLLVVTPLAIWAATSGGGDDAAPQGLIVERAMGGFRTEPELLISIADRSVAATRRDAMVRLRCVDATGKVVVSGTHPWPFVVEAGYDLPHTHQPAAPDELERVRRCRLLGTSKRLEAEVG